MAGRRFRALLEDARVPVGLFVVTRSAYLLDVLSSDGVLRDFVALDSERFLAAGRLIASGELLGGPQPFEFAPLYAYFLAVFSWVHLGIWSVYAVQVALGGLSTWLILRLGRGFFGRAAGVIAASLWALYGAAGMLELKIMDTTLSTTLLVGALHWATRPTPALRARVSAGVVLGLACLARPNALPLVPITAYWILSRGTWRWRPNRDNRRYQALALLMGAVLAIAPVTLRNRLVTGSWTLVSNQGGVAFYQGNNPGSHGTYARPAGFSGEPLKQGGEARSLAEAAEGRQLTPSEVERHWYARGFTFLTDDWVHAVALEATKCALWFGSAELSVEYVFGAERELFPALWLMSLPYGILLGGAVLGMSKRALLGKRGLLLAWLAANLLAAIVFFFASRYRAPAVPVLCLLAGDGLAGALRRFQSKRRKAPWPKTYGVAMALTALSLCPLSDDESRQQASYFFLLGNGYFAAHSPEIAIHHYERAVAQNPDSWKIRHNLGEAYGAVGRYRAAVDELTFAARLDPTAASTRRALIYYEEALAAPTRLEPHVER